MIQGREVTSCAGACRGYVDVGNDQLRVSQRGRDEVLPESGNSGFREKFIDL